MQVINQSLWRDAIRRMLLRIQDSAERVGDRFPHWANQETGEWTTTPQGDWTGGYWVGELWLAYKCTGEARYRTWARRYVDLLRPRIASETVFKAFLFYYAGRLGATVAGDAAARAVAVDGARSLMRLYDERLGLIPLGTQAEEGGHIGTSETSIDSLSASPLLFWAATETGETAMREMAISHTNRVIDLHLRPDGSFIQSSSLDPITGALLKNYTHKGHSETSTWARAQCWGPLFGAMSYILGPKNERWLAAAMKGADWWMSHVPADRVAFWDFDDPAIPHTERDTSATAITAAALLKLSVLAPERAKRTAYRQYAEETVASLADRYLTPVGPDDNRVPGMLTGGCFNKRPDARALDAVNQCELIFAAYYLFESLQVLAGNLEPTAV